MATESRPIRLNSQAKLIVVAVVTALLILFFRQVSSILPPFIAAFITAYLLNPIVTFLHRRSGLSRAIWILVLYVLLGLLIYGLATLLWPQIAAQYHGLMAQVPNIIEQSTRLLASFRTISVAGLQIELGPLEEQVFTALGELGRDLPTRGAEVVITAVETVLFFLIWLVINYYLLLQGDQFMDWLYGLIPAPYRGEIRELGAQVDRILSGYIRGQFVLIIIMSVLTYIALSIYQVPYALVIAILTGVLETIPLLGPWSAAGIAVTVSLFQPVVPFGLSNWMLAIVVALTYFSLRQMEDIYIIPAVVGHLVELHPALVLFAIVAGGAFAGPLGLLLCIPGAAVARILLRYLYRKVIDAPPPPPDDPPPSRTRPRPREFIARPPHTAAIWSRRRRSSRMR